MIGTMLGNRYELLEKIGEGGMALVYKAKCHLLNRYVAVKILKEQFSSDAEFVEKFKMEATAAASLSDNNIVNIYDVGTQGDINYIVMEYVKGKTLKQIIRSEGRINTNRAIFIASQIAKALECAHRNNIIHRDIKPHNILVTDEGVVKVTDFGIAKASNSVTITNSSKIMGSAHYFSPEQARGSFADGRTDIYSLGIVIYEMVTGRVPYDAESPVSVALKHIQEPVVPPKQINDNIPDSLNKLILKAIEKEPIRRYQSIKDMLMDLKKIENNQHFNISTNDFEEDMTRVMDPIVLDDNYNKNKSKSKNYKSYSDDEEDDDEYGGKKIGSNNRKILIGIAVAVMVTVIGAVSGYFAFNQMSDPSANETIVPKIVGMNQEDAKKEVENKKLKFVFIGKEKSDKPEGTVLETWPTEGTKVKVGSDVRVSISGGQEPLGVPNLTGIELSTAKDIITNSGLKLGTVNYKFSDSVRKDLVISQDPEPDSNATTDTKINLVVSKGSLIKMVTVPDVGGKNIDEAASLISEAGLKVSKTPIDTSDKSQDGKVVSQSIEGKQQVKEGSTVNITYYKYKQTEQAPNNEQNNQQPGAGNNTQPSNGDQAAGSGKPSGSTDGSGTGNTGSTGNTAGSSSNGGTGGTGGTGTTGTTGTGSSSGSQASGQTNKSPTNTSDGEKQGQ
ncbi:Stk1 family PASTA domain-containing Ser/Thr kinase [Clostridium sp. DJ247]|uniref:Stk1 family PASTA domain-containing Ser/Thr kinase n=1 Tax=Clostridium sp. DJ247 TaxID=2726188 RepID=UPI00162952D8|nr:Stk1 family PASTA domain-containing Ser/Thr kinase [Clostridium sp. DJ247]MBC2578973.1 Stk1 family PASTA domain-containing Ser/Thr kinase [Clostridium sp. DJ247]